jgi:cytochrome c-type biogenesis protein CcmH/NrfG
VATTAVPKQAIHKVSTSVASNLDLRKLSTHNLLKIGYEGLRSGSPEQSISIFSEAVRRDRNDPISRRYLGYALLEAGRPAEAIGQFEALRKLRSFLPSDQVAMQQAVQTEQSIQQAKLTQPAQEAGENETLISTYRAAILTNPKDLDSKYNLAVIYSKSGRTTEALHECLTGMHDTVANSEEQQRFGRLYASLATSSPSQT